MTPQRRMKVHKEARLLVTVWISPSDSTCFATCSVGSFQLRAEGKFFIILQGHAWDPKVNDLSLTQCFCRQYCVRSYRRLKFERHASGPSIEPSRRLRRGTHHVLEDETGNHQRKAGYSPLERLKTRAGTKRPSWRCKSRVVYAEQDGLILVEVRSKRPFIHLKKRLMAKVVGARFDIGRPTVQPSARYWPSPDLWPASQRSLFWILCIFAPESDASDRHRVVSLNDASGTTLVSHGRCPKSRSNWPRYCDACTRRSFSFSALVVETRLPCDVGDCRVVCVDDNRRTRRRPDQGSDFPDHPS